MEAFEESLIYVKINHDRTCVNVVRCIVLGTRNVSPIHFEFPASNVWREYLSLASRERVGVMALFKRQATELP